MRCGVPLASLRAEPRDDAEQVTQALEGEPLRVEAERGRWARVVTAYDYSGWVRLDALAKGEGAVALGEMDFLQAARSYLGAPYEWGGMTRGGIDCSGLVHMASRASGRLVPRDAWQQEAAAERVAPGDECEGDLVFYGGSERADHVSIWLGGGRILHATGRDGLGVVEEPEPDDLQARRRGVGQFAAARALN